jgi:site-specific recombinase XerD
MASILTTLRVFLRFLYLNEYTKTDQSLNVPKYTRYYYPKVPSVWKKDDVIKLLKSIDRGNPTGKRDYAILLMITKLGIRVGDLKTLKLSSLDWNSRTIKFNQSKTKNEVSYPILDDIGWALIDYLKNGRPKSSNSQCIFIRLNAPFDEFGKDANLHYIISKHTREAGIKIPKGNRCGMHSLRHTLASILLEDGIPLPVITDILGHSSSKSTSTYIRTSIENLKNCVLDPDEKPTNE